MRARRGYVSANPAPAAAAGTDAAVPRAVTSGLNDALSSLTRLTPTRRCSSLRGASGVGVLTVVGRTGQPDDRAGSWAQGATVTIEVADAPRAAGRPDARQRSSPACAARSCACRCRPGAAGGCARASPAGRWTARRSSRRLGGHVEAHRSDGAVSRDPGAGVAAPSGRRIAVPPHRACPLRMADP